MYYFRRVVFNFDYRLESSGGTVSYNYKTLLIPFQSLLEKSYSSGPIGLRWDPRISDLTNTKCQLI